ncbi:MAG: TfoX/Sxy family protein [Chthonomonadaceae bacterium]|nr:TfoX/Sxy family protein [Chthonomonadaceae bacterium]
MPVSKKFWEGLRAQLESARPVTHRKMFGGIGLYCGGPVFGIVDNDHLFFKVDSESVAPYDEAGSDMWMYDPAVGPIPKYREVPRFVLADPDTLGKWIDAAAAAAIRLDSEKKPKRKVPRAQ